MRRSRTGGQAVVEFALAFPVFVAIVLAMLQVGLLFLSYFSQARMTRETARWLAVNAATATDAQVLTHLRDTLLPPLIGTPIVAPTVTAGRATARLGNLTASYTACLPDAQVPPTCTNADRRADGLVVVELTYDAATVVFLPVFDRARILPVSRVSLLVE